MRKNRQTRRGSVAVLAAVCLTGVMSFAALALDAALLHNDRRSAQAAADASAMAAASNMFANYRTNKGTDPSGSASNEAFATALANGFNNDGTTNTVVVNIPPLNGPFIGIPGYAEVIITQNQARGFSTIWGSGTIAVKARAVARGRWVPKNDGILVLDPTSSGSLSSNGGAAANTTGSIIVDSSSASGGVVTGGGALTSPEFDFTGNPGWSTSGGGTFTGTIFSNQPPTPDPLAYLPEPSASALGLTQQATKGVKLTNGAGSLSLQPGVYTGGINVTGGSLTMAPGIYIMDGGGFGFSGQGNLTAQGVMIVNLPTSNADTISITGSGVIQLSPLTSGIYQGISLWQQRSSTNTLTLAGGGAGSDLEGTFYAQHGTLKVSGGNGLAVGSQYISWDLNIMGGGGLFINWNPNQVAPLRTLQLVE
jgi:hypothetical protein